MKHRSTDLLKEDAGDSDFVVRERLPRIWQIPLLFVVTFCIIYFAANSIQNSDSKMLFVATLVIIIGAMSWFVVWFTQRNRDMLLVTEFQNALFASAASLATRFCMIAKRDGTIVYFDPGFQKIFPDFVRKDLRTIDELLEYENVDKHAMHTVLSTMEDDKNARTIIPLTLPSGHKVSMMVSIDALPRPRGYFLFRGREYVERRKEERADEQAVLQHMAHALPLGVYTASPEGELEFVNQTLESWLGYNTGEITASTLRFRDLLAEEPANDTAFTQDFETDLTLRCKNGKPMNVHITQRPIAPDGSTSQGYTGIVTTSDDATTKKKVNI